MSKKIQSTPRLRSQNGSIIVFVLVFVVLLTFIVTAFLEEATSKIKYYGLFHNRDDLRVDAYSAMEVALAVISQYRDAEGALWGPAQGWADPLNEAGFQPANAREVRFSFEDESAKIPINTADYALLLSLFTQLGFELQSAQALADGLLDWIDEDDLRRLNGFDGDDYAIFNPPFRPANAPVRSWDEFRLMMPFRELFWDEDGVPDPAWAAFRSAVSLYHSGSININGANSVVLSVLEDQGRINRPALEDFLAGPDRIPGTDDDRLLRGNQAGLLGAESGLSTEITLLRIRIEAIRGEARFQLEGLVTWAGANPAAGGTRGTTNPQTNPDRNVRGDAGTTLTAPDSAAELGYPFRFLVLTENRNF